jgi:hypothetical protein
MAASGGAKSTLASVIRRIVCRGSRGTHHPHQPGARTVPQDGGGVDKLRRLGLAGQVVKVRIAEPGSMIVVLVIDDRALGQ